MYVRRYVRVHLLSRGRSADDPRFQGKRTHLRCESPGQHMAGFTAMCRQREVSRALGVLLARKASMGVADFTHEILGAVAAHQR